MMEMLKGWFDPEVREKDVKLLGFGAVVAFGILKLSFTEITPDWNTTFMGLCALVGIGGPAMVLAEKAKE